MKDYKITEIAVTTAYLFSGIQILICKEKDTPFNFQKGRNIDQDGFNFADAVGGGQLEYVYELESIARILVECNEKIEDYAGMMYQYEFVEGIMAEYIYQVVKDDGMLPTPELIEQTFFEYAKDCEFEIIK